MSHLQSGVKDLNSNIKSKSSDLVEAKEVAIMWVTENIWVRYIHKDSVALL